MDRNALLENFRTFAEAPGGVEHLRNLVLRLGVRGCLGTQNVDDEPVAQLLERVRGELDGVAPPKGRQATGKRLAGDAALFVGLPPSSIVTPDGWEAVSLAAVSRLESGHTPDKKVAGYWGGDVPWIGIRDARLHRDETIHETEKSITQAGIDNSSTRLLPAGTVCLSRTASVGYAVIMGRPMCTSQDFVNFVCTSGLVPRYLQIVFMAERAALLRFAKGAVHSTIYFPEVKAFHVLLPPVDEQRRIVKRVDDLLELCDAVERRQADANETARRLRKSAFWGLANARTDDELRRRWQLVDAHWGFFTGRAESIRDLRDSVLRLGVQGKLIRQSSDDAPARHLLEDLRRTRGDVDPMTPPITEAPALPDGWCWTTFGEATINRDSERVPLRKADRACRPGPYEYYGASGVIDRIDDYLFEGDLLLIAEDGANLVSRSTPIAFMASGRFWVNNHAHVVDSIEPDALRYLALFLNSIDLRPHLTGIAQPKLNQARLNKIPVPLPPLAEQRRIVTEVDRLLDLCEETESRLSTQETLASLLSGSAVAAMSTQPDPHLTPAAG